MIGISKLYCGAVEASDPLRYGRHSKDLPSHLLQFSADKKPVVVWNVTRRCNLRCVHCYSQSEDRGYSGELSFDEGKSLIDDLAGFGSPVILFSGGEPLIRPDILDLSGTQRSKGGELSCPQTGRSSLPLWLKNSKISVCLTLESVWTVFRRPTTHSGAFPAHLHELWQQSRTARM